MKHQTLRCFGVLQQFAIGAVARGVSFDSMEPRGDLWLSHTRMGFDELEEMCRFLGVAELGALRSVSRSFRYAFSQEGPTRACLRDGGGGAVDPRRAAQALGVHPQTAYLALPPVGERDSTDLGKADAWRIYEEVIKRHGSWERHLRFIETRAVLACLDRTFGSCVFSTFDYSCLWDAWGCKRPKVAV
jgi:hypothetical protein